MKSDGKVATLPHDLPAAIRTVLRRCLEKDPRDRIRDIGGRPHRSSHIWEYPLPDHLAPGLYRVEVTSEDEFGQRRQGRFSFEVTGG